MRATRQIKLFYQHFNTFSLQTQQLMAIYEPNVHLVIYIRSSFVKLIEMTKICGIKCSSG